MATSLQEAAVNLAAAKSAAKQAQDAHDKKAEECKALKDKTKELATEKARVTDAHKQADAAEKACVAQREILEDVKGIADADMKEAELELAVAQAEFDQANAPKTGELADHAKKKLEDAKKDLTKYTDSQGYKDAQTKGKAALKKIDDAAKAKEKARKKAEIDAKIAKVQEELDRKEKEKELLESKAETAKTDLEDLEEAKTALEQELAAI